MIFTGGAWFASSEMALLHLWLIQGYAAVILSFLGAIHWGALLRVPDAFPPRLIRLFYLWSIAPALLAWVSMVVPTLLLLPPQVTFLVLIIGYILSFLVDNLAIFCGLFPHWYGGLRRWLSSVALLSLIAAMLAISQRGLG